MAEYLWDAWIFEYLNICEVPVSECGGQSLVTVGEIESIWRIQTGRELKVWIKVHLKNYTKVEKYEILIWLMAGQREFSQFINSWDCTWAGEDGIGFISWKRDRVKLTNKLSNVYNMQ